jgi:outer membrane receptor protein involved in Fe transport
VSLLTIAALLLVTQSAALTGTVRSIDGAPVAGARVVIQKPGAAPLSATTDASGTFTFQSVVRPVEVQVSAPGFAPARRAAGEGPLEIFLLPAPVTESVVVTGDRAPVWGDTATGATVLANQEIQSIPALTTDEAIRVVSGLSLFRRSSARASNPTTHGVTMRGLSASGASRGLVLMDGVPLNEGFGGWVTWTRVPPAAISRVEIERGAKADALGSDAVGGVIRFVPVAGAQRLTTISAEIGSHDTATIDVAGGGRAGLASLFGAASWLETGGVIPMAPESRGAIDVRADASWFNGFGRAEIASGGKRFTLSGWGGRDERGNGTVVQTNTMEGGTVAAAFEMLSQATTFATRFSISPNSFYQTFSAPGSGRNSETLTSTQTTDTLTSRAVVEVGKTMPKGHVLVRGAFARARADFTDVRPTTTVTQDLRDDSEAISVEGVLTPASRVSIVGGARHEWRVAPTSADSRDTATVGRVVGAFRIDDTIVARGSVATSHRWPTLNELVRNFQAGAVLTLANPDLLPERGLTVEGGAGMSFTRWSLSSTLFHTVLEDAIANVTLPPTGSGIVRQRRNAGDVHATGIEFDGEVRPIETITIRGSLTLTDSTFVDSAEAALEGKQLPQVPRAAGSIWGQVQLPWQMDATLVWRSIGAQFDDDRNQFELETANQLDARVGGRWRAFSAHLMLENISDARVEVGRTPLVTLAPGRAVRISVTWRK